MARTRAAFDDARRMPHLGRMNVYTVTGIQGLPALEQALTEKFPSDHIKVTNGTWLVAGFGTAQEMCGRLGMPIVPGQASSQFTAMVTLVSGYYGFGPTNIWEWIAAKQGSQNG